MKPYRTLILITIISALIMAGCQANSKSFASAKAESQAAAIPNTGYKDISPEELNRMLESKDFLLVNVHTPYIGNIDKTDLSIPYDQIEHNLDKLPQDKASKIVLYCSSGHMSSIAAQKLSDAGYTHVFSLKGGVSAWQQAGFSIQK